jgi:uncharacterized protein (TIGR02246 family)
VGETVGHRVMSAYGFTEQGTIIERDGQLVFDLAEPVISSPKGLYLWVHHLNGCEQVLYAGQYGAKSTKGFAVRCRQHQAGFRSSRAGQKNAKGIREAIARGGVVKVHVRVWEADETGRTVKDDEHDLVNQLKPKLNIQGLKGRRKEATQSNKVKREIKAINAEFMTLFNSGQLEAVSALYTEEGQLLAPGFEPFVGRSAIAAVLGGLRGDGAALRLDTQEVEGGGDYAWEVGRYTLTAPDGTEADRGKYVVVWKREGGCWRLHRDILNTSRAA